MSLGDSLGTFLGLGVVALLGYVWYEYLGGKNTLSGLTGGGSGGSSTQPFRSWWCIATGLGCPSDEQGGGNTENIWVVPQTSTPAQTEASQELNTWLSNVATWQPVQGTDFSIAVLPAGTFGMV
jgi:hypothetical protein